MPNVVRFVLDSARDLHVPGAGQFSDGVLDVDANNLAAVARVRYLVQPYRAIELGIVASTTPPPVLPAAPSDVTPTPDPYPQYLRPSELPPLVGVLDAAAEFGLLPSQTAASNSTRLVDAHAAATSAGLELLLPPGVLPLQPGIRLASDVVRLRGAGSKSTTLSFATNSDHGLTIGSGTYVNDLGQQGWVRDFGIAGPSRPARGGGQAALRLDTWKFGQVENVYARNYDVGYDMIGNCYGTDLHNVHSRYSTVNLGLRLRPSLVNGNDHNFHNCWLSGFYSAVSVEPDAGTGADGFHFWGGQFMAGNGSSADQDAWGALQLAYDWQTAAAVVGLPTRVGLYGTTFEGINRRWCIRAYQSMDVFAHNVGFNLQGVGADAALGILKHDQPYADRIVLIAPRYSGTTKDTDGLALTPDANGHPAYVEIAPSGFLNGLPMHQQGLFERANVSTGVTSITNGAVRSGGVLLAGASAGGATQAAPNLVATINERRAVTDATAAQAINATAARDTTVFRVATAPSSYKVTATGTAAIGLSALVANAPTVVPGVVVTAKAQLQSSVASRSGKISLYWLTAANAFISAADGTYTGLSTTGFTQVSVTGTAPATAAKFQWVINGVSGAANDAMWVTEIEASAA